MVYLADVNFLLAILYAGHSSAPAAAAWLERRDGSPSVLLCRVAQMGVLRLLTYPQVMQDDVLSPREAWAIWGSLGTDPRFARVDEPPGLEARWREMSGALPRAARLDTDGYLAAFAIAGRHSLVTFDRGFRRFPELEALILTPSEPQ